ncbi:factor viii-associated protein [Anaeramoeba ignava]|uniref:Factor viii-associated protein n=1 Tax=Anaeramoeba ignava TaxID=1746090 RepID=A0A9Q0L6N4_ANAIG|nr:factor viii-associated protein [Anaeramoeba ignava]
MSDLAQLNKTFQSLKKRFMRKPKYNQAIEDFLSLRDKFKAKKDYSYAGLCSASISKCYNSLGDQLHQAAYLSEAGGDFLRENIELTKSLNYPNLYNNQTAGMLYSLQSAYFYKQKNFPILAANTYYQLALSMRSVGEFSQSSLFFEQTALLVKNDNPTLFVFLLKQSVDCLIDSQNYSKACKTINYLLKFILTIVSQLSSLNNFLSLKRKIEGKIQAKTKIEFIEGKKKKIERKGKQTEEEKKKAKKIEEEKKKAKQIEDEMMIELEQDILEQKKRIFSNFSQEKKSEDIIYFEQVGLDSRVTLFLLYLLLHRYPVATNVLAELQEILYKDSNEQEKEPSLSCRLFDQNYLSKDDFFSLFSEILISIQQSDRTNFQSISLELRPFLSSKQNKIIDLIFRANRMLLF